LNLGSQIPPAIFGLLVAVVAALAAVYFGYALLGFNTRMSGVLGLLVFVGIVTLFSRRKSK